jgi:hypothetical protein
MHDQHRRRCVRELFMLYTMNEHRAKVCCRNGTRAYTSITVRPKPWICPFHQINRRNYAVTTFQTRPDV